MKKNVMIAASMVGVALMGMTFGSCATGSGEKAQNDSTIVAEDEAYGEEAEAPAKTKANVKPIGDLTDSISYAYGVGIADNLKEAFESMPFEVDMKVFLKAFETALAGQTDKLKIQPDQAYQVFQHCMMNIQKQKAQDNKKAAADFMAKNAERPEVTTTASGLQYEVISTPELEEGVEPVKPTVNDRVSVHYHGTLLDGTVFDSSIERGNAAQFGVGQVIPGWQEGLQLMPVGSKYKFYIPSELAYGDQGAGDAIEPGQMLIFEVELLEILSQE